MKKKVPHFRRTVLYPEWGRSPEGEEGEQYFPVRERTPKLNQPEHAAHSFADVIAPKKLSLIPFC